jgi:hypothetical protein
MEENIKRLNPVFSDDYVSELAKDQMNKRARIKIAAEKAAAVEEAKKAERQSKRQNKNGAKK